MSFVGSMFGQNGTGLNFKAKEADLLNPSTVAQADTTFGQSQDALKQQQALVAALQAQNGIQNQSDVYNQLQGVAAGTGPNPAQAMLANTTGANVANQAALMAGQRGSSANAGLVARQAAQQGGNLQQQAAGQAAALQAQQSLNAMNSLGGIAGQQVGQQQQAVTGLNQFAQQGNQNVLNSIAAQNQAAVANAAQANQANAGIANTAAQGQFGMLGGLMNAGGAAAGAGGAPKAAKGGEVQKFAQGTPGGTVQPPQIQPIGVVNPPVQQQPVLAKPGPQSAAGRFLTGMAQPMQMTSASQAGQQMGQGIGQGVASLFGSKTAAPRPAAPTSYAAIVHGDDNQMVEPDSNEAFVQGGGTMQQVQAPVNQNVGQPVNSTNTPDMGYADKDVFAAGLNSHYKSGGVVPAKVSPGEVYLPPSKVKEVAKEGNRPGDALKKGEKIPGKAKVKGDSYDNDTVSKDLEAGGIVLPRSVTEAEDAPAAAAKFVAAILAKQGLKKRIK